MSAIENRYDKNFYLSNYFENAVVRWDCVAKEFYVKFKGKNEFMAKDGSKVVTDAQIDGNIITKEEFDNF